MRTLHNLTACLQARKQLVLAGLALGSASAVPQHNASAPVRLLCPMTPLKTDAASALDFTTNPGSSHIVPQLKPWEPDFGLPAVRQMSDPRLAMLLSHVSAAQHGSLIRQGGSRERQRANPDYTRRLLHDTLDGVARCRPDIDVQAAEVGAAMRMLHVEGAAMLEV